MSATPEQVKERIETLSASVESCIQRTEFIMRSLDSALPVHEDAASASAQDLIASQIVRATNSNLNELRQIATYYRTQLAELAEQDERLIEQATEYAKSWVKERVSNQINAAVNRPAEPAQPQELLSDEAAARRQRLSDMANAQARRAEAARAQATRSLDDEAAAAAARAAARQQPASIPVPALAPAQETMQVDLPQAVDPTPHRIPGVRGEPAPTTNLRVLTAYDRLMNPAFSPLTRIFAPSPWFPVGTGKITVGSEGYTKWHQNVSIASRETFKDKATLPQAFYGEVAGAWPEHVVIRLRDAILIWNFSFEEGSLLMYKMGLEEKFAPVEVMTASTLRSVIDQLHDAYGLPPSSAMTVTTN